MCIRDSLRPPDDAGLARGPHPLRRPRRSRCLHRAVQALPHQWPALVARRVRPRRPPDRPAPPRPALPVAPGRGRRGCPGDNRAMKIVIAAAVAASLAVSWAEPALAFCGFYVAKAD